MTKVSVLVRISVEDLEKINDSVKEITEKFKPIDILTEEVGFGIKVIKAVFHVNEDDGSSGLEEDLSKLENIANVDVLEVDRLS
jgi:translation elongation factor EF-1beta